jgi:hypothetical protein
MATPPLPPILTPADWDKNTTKLKSPATKEISLQLKAIGAVYKTVQWRRFDIRQVLGPKAAAADIEQALKAAKSEYDRNVDRLVDNVEGLTKLIRATEAKIKLNPLTRSSAPHLAKVAQAAQQFGVQAKLVKAEFSAFEKALEKAKKEEALKKQEEEETEPDEAEQEDDHDDDDSARPVAVRDVIGADWFASLDRLTFYRSKDLQKWSTLPDLALSARDGKPASNLQSLQASVKRDLARFNQAYTRLKALRDRNLPRADALRQARDLWRVASEAFSKPGLVHAHHDWEVRQVAASGRERFEEWKTKHAAAVDLHEKVGQVLDTEDETIVELGAELAKLR